MCVKSRPVKNNTSGRKSLRPVRLCALRIANNTYIHYVAPALEQAGRGVVRGAVTLKDYLVAYSAGLGAQEAIDKPRQ